MSDVYSFGILLWEMVTGVRPWAGLLHAQIIHAVFHDRDHPRLPEREHVPQLSLPMEKRLAHGLNLRSSF